MKLYDKNLNLIKDDITEIIVNNNVIISKKINGIHTLKFSAYRQYDIALYNNIKAKNIIEVENDYYVIDNVKKTKDIVARKEIVAYHIFEELKTQYWENDFAVINPQPWQANTRITIGNFYSYNSKFYRCIESHVSTNSFDISKFDDVSSVEDNYMPATTPAEVLARLLNGTDWTVILGDTFDATDFYLERGSIFNNIMNMVKTWGGELYLNKRTIGLKTRIGQDKTEEFNETTNLEKLNITEDTSNLVNKLYVYGTYGLTLENLTGFKYIQDNSSIAEYGERVGEIVFNSIINEDFLLTRGTQELNLKKDPKRSIDATVLKLSSQTFNLGDTIKLKAIDFDENLTDYRIFNITYNPLDHKMTSCNLSSTKLTIASNLQEMIEDYKSTDSNLNNKIDNIQKDDVLITQVIDVVQYEVINVESAHIQNCWIKDLRVERIETNSWGRDIRNPALIGTEKERNYIVVEDQHITFITETIDLTTIESLIIPNPDPIVGGNVNVYYTAVGNHPDAYKYYTITKPSLLNNQIPPEDDPLYEVKVYAVKEIGGVKQSFPKLNFTFTDDGTNNIIVTLGAGDGITDKSNKFRMFKGVDYTELYFFDNSGNDVPNGFKLGLTHVEVKNASVPSGGGHVSNIFYGTSDPSVAIGADGDVYFKLEP